MSGSEREELTFDVMRQFVVRPDRRYRVERHDGSLVFCRTGSQFDTQWLVRGARPILGDRIADAFERSSRQKLVIGGIGIAAASAFVLVMTGVIAAGSDIPLRGGHVRGIGLLFFCFIIGLIMMVAGISTRRASATAPSHDFSLPLSDIVDASLLPPQSELARRGEPQVARLHIQSGSGGTFRLAIPTDADLESVKSVIPKLAA